MYLKVEGKEPYAFFSCCKIPPIKYMVEGVQKRSIESKRLILPPDFFKNPLNRALKNSSIKNACMH